MAEELGDFIEAAGLLEYDPAAITRIYAGHPQRLIQAALANVGPDRPLALWRGLRLAIPAA